MAYVQDYSTLNFVNQLNELPMIFNSKLMPPHKVEFPDIKINSSDIFFMEYDFSLEHRVLDNIEKERVLKATQAKQLADAKSDHVKNDDDSSYNMQADMTANSHNCVPKSHCNNTVTRNASPFNTSSILTPTPIQNVPNKMNNVSDNKDDSGIDLKDFESEDDPFEKMSLKVLNDKQELNDLLAFAMPSNNIHSSQNKLCSNMSENCDSQNVKSVPCEIIDNNQLEMNISMQSVSLNVKEKASNLKDITYPNADNIIMNKSSVTTQFSKDNIFMNYYPPSTTPSTKTSNDSAPYNSRISHPCVPSNTPANTFMQLKTTHLPFDPFSTYSVRNPLVIRSNMHHQNNSFNQMFPSINGNKDCEVLRYAKSDPDLTQNDISHPTIPNCQTPPPDVLLSSLSKSCSPPNRSDQHTSLNGPSNYVRCNGTPVSPSNIPNIPSPDLPDPYDRLPPQSKAFVDNISEMGFVRSRVARTVEQLGTDPKQVLDYLVFLGNLVDKGYSEKDCECAMKYDFNDFDQALKFLKLLYQFKELGFEEENVKKSLINNKLDENKILDELTCS